MGHTPYLQTSWNISVQGRGGGIGMVITEIQYVTNKTDPWINYITTADTDEQMKGWATLVEAIHAEGAKCCIRLGCGLGRNAFPFSDEQMVSASEVPSFYFPDWLCRAFTIDEIRDMVGRFTGFTGACRI